MATAEQQKIATRRLTQWIENDKRIVTYRDISREVGCHVNVAKNLLLSHFESNPDLNLSPTYLLTGPLLAHSTINQTQLHSLTQVHSTNARAVRIVDMDEMSDDERNSEHGDADEDQVNEVDDAAIGNDSGAGEGEGEEDGLIGSIQLDPAGLGRFEKEEEVVRKQDVPRWGVVLVQGDQLDEKKKLFEQETLSIHIHSLAPSLINDPAQYLIPNLTLREHKNYRNPQMYGTITGEALRATAPLAADKKAMKDGGMDWSGSKKVVGGSTATTSTVTATKKEDVEVPEEAKKADDKKKASTSTAAASTSKAPESEHAAKSKTKATSTPTGTQTGSISGKKKRVIHSDTEEDESEPPASSKKGQTGPEARVKVEPTSSMVRADDQRAMEAMMSMDMDMDIADPSDPNPLKDVKVKEEPREEKLKGGIRKKRRVKKSKTVEDKKGRIVTRDYSTDESYTASEDEGENGAPTKSKVKANAKPLMKARESTSSIGSADTAKRNPASSGSGAASHPPPRKAGGGAGGGGAKGQSTLKGFFTKKT
ncbi:uncharacterized protein I303_103231 [Kwoniella dejecticola CBS 10117]|uniref:DNA polymerase delta subunit 3 n=1 Tax=Kwoniella dejecticola CBS 10117 TaxID=1296121 RepID=A0A1A6AAZ9_9TREE|nr:uncharacterized protein I303_03254 [Kwoniella dejecticola CBS 10117]OBR87229.1 hypothetical protein I303_03254 [Kwoniella dejecticola CBS 10117]